MAAHAAHAAHVTWLSDVARRRCELHEDAVAAFLSGVTEGRVSGQELVWLLCTLESRLLERGVIAAFVKAVQQLSPPLHLPGSEGAVNAVGTGGGLSTFNISTAAAFVAAAAGARVLKSGSRSYTGKCGSLNVLRALGVALPKSPNALTEMLETFGLAFVSEAHYSPVFSHMASALLPVPFVDVAGFVNRVGPLLCPYRVAAQLIGTSTAELFATYVALEGQLQLPTTLVVHSSAGIDELTSVASNLCYQVGTRTGSYLLEPSSLGFAQADVAELAGDGPAANARRLVGVCSGEIHGAARDTVLLNAAQLLQLANTCPSVRDGLALASAAIDSGAVRDLLARMRAWSLRAFSTQPLTGPNLAGLS